MFSRTFKKNKKYSIKIKNLIDLFIKFIKFAPVLHIKRPEKSRFI